MGGESKLGGRTMPLELAWSSPTRSERLASLTSNRRNWNAPSTNSPTINPPYQGASSSARTSQNGVLQRTLACDRGTVVLGAHLGVAAGILHKGSSVSRPAGSPSAAPDSSLLGALEVATFWKRKTPSLGSLPSALAFRFPPAFSATSDRQKEVEGRLARATSAS
jgi:hypothetical protein